MRRLECLRGIGDLTALALAVEIGQWDRFTGRTIAAFVGLVPSEYSSGATRAQGSITKTGNTHVRRLLVEAAWRHRARSVPGKALRQRWEHASPAARARGDAGNQRLHQRWNSYRQRRKNHNVATIAIARELAGWTWSWPPSRTTNPAPTGHRPPKTASSTTREARAARGATHDSAMSNPTRPPAAPGHARQ